MAIIDQLKGDPKVFLGTKPLIVAGNPPMNAANHQQSTVNFTGGSVVLKDQTASLSLLDLSIALEHGKYKIYVPAAAGEASSSYYLPWKEGSAYSITLGADAQFFTTAHMSSCALLIGGTPAAPTVIHANCGNSPRIGTKLSANIDSYTSLYNNLLQALVTGGQLPPNSPGATPIAMHDPGLYMTGSKAGYTAVIGRRSGGSWSFFYNVNNGVTGFTGQLWPSYDRFPY